MKKTINDVYMAGQEDFVKSLRYNRKNFNVHYMINPRRITIWLPAFSVVEADGYLGSRSQDCITFLPTKKDIAAAIKAAENTYAKDYLFGPLINKIVDIAVKVYERRYGTIRR